MREYIHRSPYAMGIYILLLSFILSGCALFKVSESHKKIDAKAMHIKFLQETPEMKDVLAQKNKDIPASYKLEGKLEALKRLDIVNTAQRRKDRIEVNFIAKAREGKEKKDQSMEEILWGNSLFLLYTVVDTFPDVETIHLSADYYFLDEYGYPYKEKIFLLTAKKASIHRINRHYFRPEMLSNLVDYYMSESAKKLKEAAKQNE